MAKASTERRGLETGSGGVRRTPLHLCWHNLLA